MSLRKLSVTHLSHVSSMLSPPPPRLKVDWTFCSFHNCDEIVFRWIPDKVGRLRDRLSVCLSLCNYIYSKLKFDRPIQLHALLVRSMTSILLYMFGDDLMKYSE